MISVPQGCWKLEGLRNCRGHQCPELELKSQFGAKLGHWVYLWRNHLLLCPGAVTPIPPVITRCPGPPAACGSRPGHRASPRCLVVPTRSRSGMGATRMSTASPTWSSMPEAMCPVPCEWVSPSILPPKSGSLNLGLCSPSDHQQLGPGPGGQFCSCCWWNKLVSGQGAHKAPDIWCRGDGPQRQISK